LVDREVFRDGEDLGDDLSGSCSCILSVYGLTLPSHVFSVPLPMIPIFLSVMS
jgi:hypothetical protein